MAVGTTTASDPDRSGFPPTGGRAPVRTCIGCRKRAAAAELLRVVVGQGPFAVPDPRHRAAGRGAWVHRDPGCVELAERRRAFGRALRVPGRLDAQAVREYVAQLGQGPKNDPTSGTPQE